MLKIFQKVSFSKDPYCNKRQYITDSYREILFYDYMNLYRFHNICDKTHDIISIFILNRVKMIYI